MWWLSFPTLAYLLAGAHFLRNGEVILVGVAVMLLGSLAVPRAWVAHLTRLALFTCSLVWLNALVAMAAMRYSMGLPFLRLVLILGTVILLTAGAIFVFFHPRIRRYYQLGSD